MSFPTLLPRTFYHGISDFVVSALEEQLRSLFYSGRLTDKVAIISLTTFSSFSSLSFFLNLSLNRWMMMMMRRRRKRKTRKTMRSCQTRSYQMTKNLMLNRFAVASFLPSSRKQFAKGPLLLQEKKSFGSSCCQ